MRVDSPLYIDRYSLEHHIIAYTFREQANRGSGHWIHSDRAIIESR